MPEADDEVDEIVALEADGGIGIRAGHGQRGEVPVEHVERTTQVLACGATLLPAAT